VASFCKITFFWRWGRQGKSRASPQAATAFPAASSGSSGVLLSLRAVFATGTYLEAIPSILLLAACKIPSRTTGQKAPWILLSEDRIQCIGKGTKGDPFRYFEKRAKKKKRKGSSVFGIPLKTFVG
jgi:hypothetical protein